jgi:hypothetical protein
LPNLQPAKEIRMHLHANAALGPAGRRKLVGLIEQGHSLRAAAAALSVSPATAHRWWHRWIGASPVWSCLTFVDT